MYLRAIAIFAVFCVAFGEAGCASKSKRNYEEVLLPTQTGSLLHRRVLVRTESEKKSKKKKKPSARKPEAEPTATPAPEEESTPPPDRFR